MSVSTEIRPLLINAAQALLQVRGYHGFDFSDLSKLIGCSESVIRQVYISKASLATEVTRRYTDQFLAELKGYEKENPEQIYLLAMYIKRFRYALVDQDRLCLCGMLGAEVESLPKPVKEETKRFFELNQKWLTQVFRKTSENQEQAQNRANVFLSAMEGAMILARSIDKMSIFDNTTKTLVASLI